MLSLPFLVPLSFNISLMGMDHIKFVCWNCRGISLRDTSNKALDFIHKFKPLVVFFVKTKANEDRILRFCRRLPTNWDCAAILAEGFSGGILVSWNKRIG